MLTLNDLTIERVDTGIREASTWEKVSTPDGRKFLVGSCDMSPVKSALELGATGVDVERPEGFSDEDIFLFIMGALPERETWVMEATELPNGEWVPANECGPHCETGVCNKRLATDEKVASQERGYTMLLNALNA
jgi:hypothetical protein